MNRRLPPAVLLFVLLAAIAVVPAQARPLSPNYAVLKLGGFFPQGSDLDGFDSGFNGEIALGHVVAPGFAFEGGIGYYETQGDFTSPLLNVTEKFKVMPVTFSLKGLAYFQQFEPYAEAGIGVYFIEDEISGTAGSIPFSDSENDAQVGFHLGAGANFNVTQQLFLGLEGKYLWLRTDTFGVDVRLDGITLTGNVGLRF